MSEEIKNTSTELTDEEIENAAGGRRVGHWEVPDDYVRCKVPCPNGCLDGNGMYYCQYICEYDQTKCTHYFHHPSISNEELLNRFYKWRDEQNSR